MSSTGTEQAIVSAKANVMIYDDLTKKWNPAGAGLSKVYIYQNLLNQTYRVVGRKIHDNECVINCMLSKNIKYQANQTFLQWRDVKQVYGLHFQSTDESDKFAQVLKTSVDNLARIAAANGGDNISLGKRSISSEYNSPLIYDESDSRQNYNLNSHHQNGIYPQRSQQTQQQQVTSPPLSNSSSSSSSTISSNNGLSINTINAPTAHKQQQMIQNNNGHHHQQQQSSNNQQQASYQRQQNNNNMATTEYTYNNNNGNPVYNLQQQINTSSTSSSSSSSSVGSGGGSHGQHPMYQSSPIPPPPPPPSVPIFNNHNGNNFNHNNNNNNANDNLSQKIYDVIPDNSNYTPNHQSIPTSIPPPPPPMPIGLFSSLNCPAPPPPPPPISSMQSLNLNNINNIYRSSMPSHADELSRSIANRQLKKEGDLQQSSVVKNETNNNSSSSNRPQVPPQLDFLTEIRMKLEAKNLGANASNENENLKPSNGLKKIKREPIKNESPKSIKKNTSTPNVLNGTAVNNQLANGSSGTQSSTNLYGHTNGNSQLDIHSYDRLKQELLSEFRKELQMIKSDIVNSILQELRR